MQIRISVKVAEIVHKLMNSKMLCDNKLCGWHCAVSSHKPIVFINRFRSELSKKDE
jgi:hypothetical protein